MISSGTGVWIVQDGRVKMNEHLHVTTATT